MSKKCGYYSDGECNICGMGMSGEDTFCRLCKDNPNCYYKQLDKLRTEKDKYYQQTLDDEITLNELYQENERLKAECNMYKTFYKAKHSDIKGLLFKLKHTLQEIKTIAEDYNTSGCSGFGCELSDIILNIIKAEEQK